MKNRKWKLLSLSAVIFAMFMYLYSIEFSIKLIGKLPVNLSAPSPTTENGSINEDYPWEFKAVMCSTDVYYKEYDVKKDIVALIDKNSDELFYIYFKADDEKTGHYSLALMESDDILEDKDMYIGIYARENINTMKITASSVGSYKVIYVLNQRYNCWVPCYAVSYEHYSASLIASTSGINEDGKMSNGPWYKGENFITAEYESENFDAELEVTDYQKEIAKKIFTQSEGKGIEWEEISEVFQFSTYVTSKGETIKLTNFIKPTLKYLDN